MSGAIVKLDTGLRGRVTVGFGGGQTRFWLQQGAAHDELRSKATEPNLEWDQIFGVVGVRDEFSICATVFSRNTFVILATDSAPCRNLQLQRQHALVHAGGTSRSVELFNGYVNARHASRVGRSLPRDDPRSRPITPQWPSGTQL